MGSDELTGRIIGSAMKVHTALGPGLLESACHACLLHQLQCDEMQVLSEVMLPIEYDGMRIEVGYRVDMIVENEVIIEIKAVKEIAAIHSAQLLSYLKLAKLHTGLLINFHAVHLRNGIKRLVN